MRTMTRESYMNVMAQKPLMMPLNNDIMMCTAVKSSFTIVRGGSTKEEGEKGRKKEGKEGKKDGRLKGKNGREEGRKERMVEN